MVKKIIIILVLLLFYNVKSDDTNCQTLDSLGNRCKECKTGFYLTYDGRYCEECDLQHGKILYSIENIDKCYTKVDNCKKYSEIDDFCELCEDGFKRNENGQCIQCGKNEIGMNNVCFKKKLITVSLIHYI